MKPEDVKKKQFYCNCPGCGEPIFVVPIGKSSVRGELDAYHLNFINEKWGENSPVYHRGCDKKSKK